MSKNLVGVKQSSAIICKELEGFSEDDRLRIIQKIRDNLKPVDGGLQNLKARHTGYECFYDDEDIMKILENVCASFKGVLTPQEEEWAVVDVWGGIYRPDDHTVPHRHLPALISFVLYLQADDHSSPLVFDECDLNVAPKNWTLVVFPSWLMHSVPPQSKDGCERIMLSGNLVPEKGMVEEPEYVTNAA